MLQRLRLALEDGTFNKMNGEVEADETFIGGKARNMHKAKRAVKITGTGGKDKVDGEVHTNSIENFWALASTESTVLLPLTV